MSHVYGKDDVLYTSASCVTHVASCVLHAMMSRVLRVFRSSELEISINSNSEYEMARATIMTLSL